MKPIWFLMSILSFCTQIRPSALFAETPPPPEVDIVIVGAGLSGLSTAYHAKKAGLTYILLEASPHIGGRIRSASYPEELQGEVGLEEIWEENPTLDIIRELHIPLEKFVTVFSSYQFGGKTLPFTQDSNESFLQSILSPTEYQTYQVWDARMAVLYAQLQKNPKDPALVELQKISFSDWVKQDKSLTEKIYELIRIQSEPEYGTSWSQICALDGIAEWHIFSGKGEESYHVIGGNQKLAEAMAAAVGMEHLSLNTRVTQIQSTENGVLVRASDASTYRESLYRGKYVVSTIPLYMLQEIQFTPPLTPTHREAIQSQTWGSYFTAHVILEAAAQEYWHVKGKNILPLRAEGPLGVIYDGFSPKADATKVLLNLLITGPAAENFNLRIRSVEQIQTDITQSLDTLWPGSGKLVRGFAFYRYHPRAIASWPVGRSRFDTLSDEMRKPFGRVYFAGDYTEGTHSHHAAQSALRVINSITHGEPAAYPSGAQAVFPHTPPCKGPATSPCKKH
jgi:monoamine oxidase